MEGRILISCREKESCNQIIHLFSGQKLQFSCVQDDADLLLEAIEGDYQAIIFDLQNSILDGLKMVKILKKIRPKISLVVISDNPSKKLGGQILQQGVAYYTVKPFRPEAIKQAVLKSLVRKE